MPCELGVAAGIEPGVDVVLVSPVAVSAFSGAVGLAEVVYLERDFVSVCHSESITGVTGY